jgi:hypothetical protein
MTFDKFGKILVKATSVILIIEIILWFSSINLKVERFYSYLFDDVISGGDTILLYIIPILNVIFLISYLIISYLFKKSKILNFQILMFALFYLLYLISSYVFLMQELTGR